MGQPPQTKLHQPQERQVLQCPQQEQLQPLTAPAKLSRRRSALPRPFPAAGDTAVPPGRCTVVCNSLFVNTAGKLTKIPSKACTFCAILSEPNSNQPCSLKNWRARWFPPTVIVCGFKLGVAYFGIKEARLWDQAINMGPSTPLAAHPPRYPGS